MPWCLPWSSAGTANLESQSKEFPVLERAFLTLQRGYRFSESFLAMINLSPDWQSFNLSEPYWNKWLLHALFLILYQRIKFQLAEHLSMSKNLYTNTNKSGKANTSQVFFFFALCKLNFLLLETELLVQVVAKCYQLLCGHIGFETEP